MEELAKKDASTIVHDLNIRPMIHKKLLHCSFVRPQTKPSDRSLISLAIPTRYAKIFMLRATRLNVVLPHTSSTFESAHILRLMSFNPQASQTLRRQIEASLHSKR